MTGPWFVILEVVTMLVGAFDIREAVKCFKKDEYFWFGVYIMLGVFKVFYMALWFYFMFV